MICLVVGASGATGRFLVRELVEQGFQVRAIVRDRARLPAELRDHELVEVIEGTILDMDSDRLNQVLEGCDAALSCLGHNLTLKGIFGSPRRLVTETTGRICAAMAEGVGSGTKKFVLMNTVGNSNRDLDEKVSFAQRCVTALLRLLVPPHADNEDAADLLRLRVGRASTELEWVVVRPDGLTNDEEVSGYDLHPSPTRSAIFDAGKTSRANVARFMTALLTDDELWNRWRGQMPVIYDRS